MVFSAAFTARYILFPKVLGMTLTHPQQSMFLGTVPMGLTTILVNISQLGTGAFDLGVWPSFVALGLWFLSAAVSLVIGVGIPWSIITYQKEHRFEGTTAALLLPIVPPVTVAAAGSVLIDQLGAQYPTLALTILVVSYLQLGIGLPLALMVQVLYLQRLILFKAPPREVIVSVFLPLGPCGQGGESALHLGRCALTLFPAVSQLPNTGVPQLTLGVGEALYGSGLVVALLLWALGMWWTIIGVATFLNEYMRGYVKFNMGFWSFVSNAASTIVPRRDSSGVRIDQQYRAHPPSFCSPSPPTDVPLGIDVHQYGPNRHGARLADIQNHLHNYDAGQLHALGQCRHPYGQGVCVRAATCRAMHRRIAHRPADREDVGGGRPWLAGMESPTTRALPCLLALLCLHPSCV